MKHDSNHHGMRRAVLLIAAAGVVLLAAACSKALGWRTRRIIAQVLGESAASGLAGAAAGIVAGAAIIAAVISSVSATTGLSVLQGVGPNSRLIGGSPVETVAVPLHPSVSAGLIALAVLLAVAGALLAGSFGSWRIARLRPADALSRVA